ncbi:MAG: exodeoxyribonuclease V subunit gamma [Acidobacteriaceae bacterium]|jgi:hypothetical protein|nr:exodeoxyribonuclease V subunit gamma [Acidobacteriaceae bacterium]
MVQVITSTSASARLASAARVLADRDPADSLLLIGASRGAADDLARRVACQSGATFGIERFSLTVLAAQVVAEHDPSRLRTPDSTAMMEAMASRAAFEARSHGTLEYFRPVAALPGFPRALARTLRELRLARVSARRLAGQGAAARDVAALLESVEAELARARIDDRAALFDAATMAWREGRTRWSGTPFVLLDVAIDSLAEREFIAAMAASADGIITVPDGDLRAIEACRQLGAEIRVVPDAAETGSDLAQLRRFIFTVDPPPERRLSGDVRLFSAPGEGRETLEIVRRVLDEASRGVRFDEMAVLLRAPAQYLGLLEHACARGGVPAYFDRGTRRPDPAGRAFVALLSCAVEGLSARRFDEYLSLGQVPRIATSPSTEQPPHAPVVLPRDEFLTEAFLDDAIDDPETANPDPDSAESDADAVVAGTLRAPWKWEALIVESAVVGGRTRADGKDRWRRRLSGLHATYEFQRAEIVREEPDSPRLARIERNLRNLDHLQRFALPIIDRLAEWPEIGTWAEWIARLMPLAGQALARPRRVLQTLAEMRPMGEVGPVSLEEVRDVLHERLVMLDWDPPRRRYGALFVGTPQQARGRAFRVVFVPGLAERVVPQRPREDPLLLDERRAQIDRALLRQDDRGSAERLLLKMAIGAASDRLYLSYPRMDVAETRARVPSFYALDVMRAMTGRVPDYRVLAADAAEDAGASLAWPAPKEASRAVDDLEHDLAVLRPLLDARDVAAVKGRANYLLSLNDHLARSIRMRWRRDQKAWSPVDGLLVKERPGAAIALAKHRLHAREYSLSALQRFSTCPYQFLLGSIHRLDAWEEPSPLVHMDPLTRGSLFHKAQAEFLRALEAKGALPLREAEVPSAVRVMDDTLRAVAAEYAEKLMPAIPRVWHDEIEELGRDLGIWVRRMAEDATWIPKYVEFSFGLNDEGRDPRSLPEAITIDGRFRLRGSVDLIEAHARTGELRVTDHKTGKNRSKPDLVIGGGAVLQPVLYSVAIEQGLSTRVVQGRLFYCTTAGGFSVHAIDINDDTRTQGVTVLDIIDRAVEQGVLLPAPVERACTWCTFRPVCGPREEERVTRKSKVELEDLLALRRMR